MLISCILTVQISTVYSMQSGIRTVIMCRQSHYHIQLLSLCWHLQQEGWFSFITDKLVPQPERDESSLLLVLFVDLKMFDHWLNAGDSLMEFFFLYCCCSCCSVSTDFAISTVQLNFFYSWRFDIKSLFRVLQVLPYLEVNSLAHCTSSG